MTTSNEQLARLAQDGCTSSRQQLIVQNQPLAIGIAGRYSNRRNNDDIFAAAMLGLTIAANTYKVDSGAKFSTYAHACITNEVFYALRRERSSVDRTQQLRQLTTPGMLMVNADAEDPIDTINVLELLQSAGLTATERRVIDGRFGLGCQRMTLEQLSNEMGLSTQRVQQIEKRVLVRLHQHATKGAA